MLPDPKNFPPYDLDSVYWAPLDVVETLYLRVQGLIWTEMSIAESVEALSNADRDFPSFWDRMLDESAARSDMLQKMQKFMKDVRPQLLNKAYAEHKEKHGVPLGN